jgi:hypothetical protein
MAKFSLKLEMRSKEEESQATTNQSTRENLITEADRECLMLGKKPKSESVGYQTNGMGWNKMKLINKGT